MKNELQHLYETALALQKEHEVDQYSPSLNEKEHEKLLKRISACTTELIISSMKKNNQGQISHDIGALMIQLFTLMAQEGISLEDINKSLKNQNR